MEEDADPFDREEVEEENDRERNSNDEGHKDDEAVEVPAKKTTVRRIVRNPQPKLNPDRLRGPKGIPELLRMSKNMKLKGKGQELQDLNLIMNTLKHWGHRLFPKIMSNDFFERVERLGTKKTVQGYVRRVRMGVENVDVATVPKSFDIVASDGEDDVQRGMDDSHRDAPREDLFENLLDNSVNDVNSESLSSSYTLQTPKTPMVFDEDAKARAERNRQLAIERRLKRLAEKGSLSMENNPPGQSESSASNSSVIQDNCEGLKESNNSLPQSSEGNLQCHSNHDKDEEDERNAEEFSEEEEFMSVTTGCSTQQSIAPDENRQLSVPGDSEADSTTFCSPDITDSTTSSVNPQACGSSSLGSVTDIEPTAVHGSDDVEADGPVEKNAETDDSAPMFDQNTEKTYDASEPLFDSPMETDELCGTSIF